jgi:hypothetical protein
MAAYLPQDWPDGMRPPGSEKFEESAAAFRRTTGVIPCWTGFMRTLEITAS